MALLKEEVGCPFCLSTIFSVSVSVNDMPGTDAPSENAVTLGLFCRKCGNNAFLVTRTQGGHVSARGAAVCRKCRKTFPRTPHPEGPDSCPECGGALERPWWHGRGFTV